MCAIFGFLDYGKKVSHHLLTELLKKLSIAAECRGTDATGISYVKDGNMVTFKKAKPAHKVKLYFPKGTTAVIGHTRFTTQGSEKHNYNNHPFEGKMETETFALAHNGVLYNDKQLQHDLNLPTTKIETDSYIAVQLLEMQNKLDVDSLRYVAETVSGNFVFTVLRNDNTLFLVKGDKDYNTNNTAITVQYNEIVANLHNITNAIEKGILTDSIIQRAEQLEAEKAQLETRLQSMQLMKPIEYKEVSHLLTEWKGMKHNTEEFRNFIQQFIKEVRIYPYHFEIVLNIGLGVVSDLTETISMRRGELYELFESKVKEEE